MTTIKYEGIASCPPAQLFRLINSVETYSKFLSWCKDARVNSRTNNAIQAVVFIQKYGIQFHCSFTYTLISNNEIKVGLPSGGPFTKVAGVWRFQGSSHETKFSFELQLEYRSSWWMNFFLIPILKNEVKNLIKAFEQRASLMR